MKTYSIKSSYYFRFAKYQDMAAKGLVDPKKLPPSKDAGHQHILWACYQSGVWVNMTETWSDPLKWGWKMVEGHYIPMLFTGDCALSELLAFIRCKCKAGCSSGLLQLYWHLNLL